MSAEGEPARDAENLNEVSQMSDDDDDDDASRPMSLVAIKEEDVEEVEETTMPVGGLDCTLCNTHPGTAVAMHKCPSPVEDSDRDPKTQELVMKHNHMKVFLKEQRETGLFLESAVNRERQELSYRELKDWNVMEKMAACIHYTCGEANACLGEIVESIKNNEHGQGVTNKAAWDKEEIIHDKMIQVGMIFACAGAQMVGMAQMRHADVCFEKFCDMKEEVEREEKIGVCSGCGNTEVDDMSSTW